jgi:uncharacterized protein YceH (UPF0502 family)
MLPDRPDPDLARLPHQVGELLARWVGAKFGEVDALVDAVRRRVDQLPTLPTVEPFTQALSDLTARVDRLEVEVAQLKAARP